MASWEHARKVGLGILSLPLVAIGAWILDPWTGWSVTGDGLVDYWRGRAWEAAIVLGIVGLIWVFKTVGEAVGRSSGRGE